MITVAAIFFWFALVGGVLLLVWPLCHIGMAVLDADTLEDLKPPHTVSHAPKYPSHAKPRRVEHIGRVTVTYYEDNPEGHHGR